MREMSKKRIRRFLIVTALLIPLILYLVVMFVLPETEEEARKVLIIIILIISSIFDIREQKVPLLVCTAILGINIMHAVFVMFNLTSWIISIVLSAILLTVYVINKDLIGLGDIILVALCVQSLLPGDTLKFLFLTFAFSTFYGLIKCIKAKSVKNIAVPLSPCIALAFILLIH